MKITKKELYIFGAGASYAAARLPLGSELGWWYAIQCTTFFEMKNGYASAADIERKKKKLYPFEDFIEIAEKIYPELYGEKNKYLSGMNKAMAYIPSFLKNNKRYFFDEMLAISSKNNDVEAVRKIKNVTYSHIADKCKNASDDTIYDSFLKRNINKDVSIISLNFDTLIKENYYDHICIDYNLNFNMYSGNRGYKKYQNCYPVLKLHGSIEWGWCENCGNIILYGPWVDSDWYGNEICNKCNNKIEPFIVIPFEDTSQYPDWFNNLWSKAKVELSNADIIYFIGYSIPDYDHNIISLLKNNINKNAKILIIDPESERIKSKIIKYGINPNNINSQYIGFEEYIKKIKN